MTGNVRPWLAWLLLVALVGTAALLLSPTPERLPLPEAEPLTADGDPESASSGSPEAHFLRVAPPERAAPHAAAARRVLEARDEATMRADAQERVERHYARRLQKRAVRAEQHEARRREHLERRAAREAQRP